MVIAYYFPPMGLSGVQRTLKFTKFLPQYGWTPIVLSASPRSFYAYDEELLSEINPDDTMIYRTEQNSNVRKTAKFPSYFMQKIGRAFLQTIHQPDSKITWKKKAVELGRKILSEHKVDAIFATAPPFTDFLVALELSREFDIPFIVDYRDVWIDNPFHFYATPFHKLYAENLEKQILTYAQKVVVTGRHTKELLLQRYGMLGHDDVVIIPHGYDREDFDNAGKITPDRGKFTITHSGLFQDDRTPKYFLKALSLFIKENPHAAAHVNAKFIGIMRKGHTRLIKKYKLDGVTECLGYLPHEQTVAELMSSDVLWLMLKDDVRTPGKLYEYFGARKPIIASLPDGAMKKLAVDTQACIATYPKDVASIKNAIARMYELWSKRILPTPDEEYVESFDRYKLTALLAKELAQTLKI